MSASRDWDAATYDRVSDIQLRWALEQLDRLILTGHCVAHSERLPSLLVEAAEENVLREASGELPEYVVNPQVEPAWRKRLASLLTRL